MSDVGSFLLLSIAAFSGAFVSSLAGFAFSTVAAASCCTSCLDQSRGSQITLIDLRRDQHG